MISLTPREDSWGRVSPWFGLQASEASWLFLKLLLAGNRDWVAQLVAEGKAGAVAHKSGLSICGLFASGRF